MSFECLQAFDQKLLQNQMKAKNIKDTMRKLLQGMIGVRFTVLRVRSKLFTSVCCCVGDVLLMSL